MSTKARFCFTKFGFIGALFLMGGSAALGQTKLYWANAGGGDAIGRADLDGSNVEILNNLDASPPPGLGLALDPAGQRVFWTTGLIDGVGTVECRRLDGVTPYCNKGISTTSPEWPVKVEFDPITRRPYWSTVEGTVNGSNGKIWRADQFWGNNEVVLSGTGALAGFTLDSSGGKIYYQSQAEGKIKRANLDGSGVEDLVTGQTDFCYAIALDTHAGKMYWKLDGQSGIRRANLDGSGLETILPDAVGLDLAVDRIHGKLYWVQNGGKIQRANLDGSSVEDVVTGISSPTAVALALPDEIPAASTWGVLVLALLLTSATTLLLRRASASS